VLCEFDIATDHELINDVRHAAFPSMTIAQQFRRTLNCQELLGMRCSALRLLKLRELLWVS